MKRIFFSKGITLVGLMVTISILASLAAVVYVSLKPAEKIQKTESLVTETNRQSIAKAVGLATADRGSFHSGCQSGPLPAMPKLISSAPGAYNIMPCLVGYFSAVPVNTLNGGYWEDANDYDTKFFITRHPETTKVVVGKNFLVNWTSSSMPSITTTVAAIAGSPDGSKVAAAPQYNYVHTSNDGGQTWTMQLNSGKRLWYNMAGSADMSRLALTVNSTEYIYVSSDGGVNWSHVASAGQRGWRGISMSADGRYLAANVTGGYIYTSSDYGVTWVPRLTDQPRAWISMASSEDGSRLAAAMQNGYIYTSSDYGATWVARTNSGIRNWYKIVSSYNGANLTAIVQAGYIYTSSDSGVTWTERTGAGIKNWASVGASRFGSVIAAAPGSQGPISISNDYGATWVDANIPINIYLSMLVPNNGYKILAGAQSGLVRIMTASLEE